jgi:hypothetical protein
MNDEFENMWKEVVVSDFRYFPGGTEDYAAPQFTVGLWAEI